MITIAILPVMIVYLLLSKYIVRGVALGGVKRLKVYRPVKSGRTGNVRPLQFSNSPFSGRKC